MLCSTVSPFHSAKKEQINSEKKLKNLFSVGLYLFEMKIKYDRKYMYEVSTCCCRYVAPGQKKNQMDGLGATGIKKVQFTAEKKICARFWD